MKNGGIEELNWKYVTYDEGRPEAYTVIVVMVEGREFSLNADWIPEEQRTWFGDCYARALLRAYQEGERAHKEEARRTFGEFLKITGIGGERWRT